MVFRIQVSSSASHVDRQFTEPGSGQRSIMAQRGAATRKAARLRATYTGEMWSRARNALIKAPSGRELHLLDSSPSLLKDGYPFAMSKHEADLAARFRAAVLPDARNWQQELLDTAVLLGIKGAYDFGREIRPFSGGPFRVLKSVTPRSDGLLVDCHPRTQAGLLANLVGTKGEDGGYNAGVPGVRMQLDGSDVHVTIAGFAHAARVVVRDVPRDQWVQLITHLNNLQEEGRLFKSPILKRRPRTAPKPEANLDTEERRALGSARQHLRHTRLSSRMVRRIGLVAESYALDAWTGFDSDLHLEFQVPSSAAEIARALHHPLTGFISGPISDDTSWNRGGLGYIRITESDNRFQILTKPDPPELQPPRLVLRPLPRGNQQVEVSDSRAEELSTGSDR
jgi:hypothetical protein